MPYISILGQRTFYRKNHKLRTELPTLLFIHGAGGNGGHWINQIAGINNSNLIALDLPGHGRSEGSAVDSIIAYREFVRHFAQALELRNTIIVGHSMGGAIALDFALAYPEMLKGLIIVDSGAKLRVNPVLLNLLSKGEHPLEIIKFSYSKKFSPDLLEKAIKEMRSVSTEVYLADFKACNEFNSIDQVQNIHVPTLVICGQEDQMTSPKYSEYLIEKITQSTLVLVPDAGHMAMLEQPDQVNRAIENFLNLYRKCV